MKYFIILFFNVAFNCNLINIWHLCMSNGVNQYFKIHKISLMQPINDVQQTFKVKVKNIFAAKKAYRNVNKYLHAKKRISWGILSSRIMLLRQRLVWINYSPCVTFYTIQLPLKCCTVLYVTQNQYIQWCICKFISLCVMETVAK